MSGRGLSPERLHGGDTVPPVHKPLIAAIRGHCVAAGLELALQCDIRIAAEDARFFGLPEAKWGLPGGYGLHNLSRTIPMGEALYMQLTGDAIDARRAHAVGLVQAVVPTPDLQAQAAAVAQRVAANSPRAVRAIKQIVRDLRDLPLAEAMKRAEPLERQLIDSGDYKEGAAAFVAKRKPSWRPD
jgi:enoyl-CoA hydratase/carnithine racemase